MQHGHQCIHSRHMKWPRSEAPKSISTLFLLTDTLSGAQHNFHYTHSIKNRQTTGTWLKFRHQLSCCNLCFVVWPTMSCFADWWKSRHVTLSIIICSTLHRHPVWHYSVTRCDVTWCSLNANVRYILRCFCLRLVCFFFVFLTSYCKFLLNTV